MNNLTTLAILAAAGTAVYYLYKNEKNQPSYASGQPDVVPPPFGGSSTSYNNTNTTTPPPPPPAYSSSILINTMVIKLRTATQNSSQQAYNWSEGISPRCKAYRDYYKLSTPDFIAVWNQYKNQYGSTIREDRDATWRDSCDFFTNTQWGHKLAQRFDALNLA